MTVPRFGVGLRANRAPADLARLARLAEGFGFDVVSVFSDLGDEPPLASLLAIAGATRRVVIGPACLNPYTMHPVEIAGAAAALEAASDGRSYLGLAKGAWLETIGVAQVRPVRAIREAVAVIRTLLSGDARGFDGELFTVPAGFVVTYPRPQRQVPLLIGAWGPATVALAGEIADELKVGGSANPDLVPVMRKRLAIGSVRARRGSEATGLVFGAVTVVDEDADAARRHARMHVARYFDIVASRDPTVDFPDGALDMVRSRLARGDVEGAGDAISDQLLDRFSFSGTPDHVADQVSRIFAGGASRVEFGAPFGLDPEAGLRLLGERVLPEVR